MIKTERSLYTNLNIASTKNTPRTYCSTQENIQTKEEISDGIEQFHG